MKLRLGAGVLLAALIPLTAVTAPSPARAGVDTTPPAVGSCHDLTWREAFRSADPDPAVGCRARHTSVTTKVLVFEDAPDWNSDRFRNWVALACSRGSLAYFDGKAKALQLSAASHWIFFPTKAQKDAGAAWARCDVAVSKGKALKALRGGAFPALRLPLNDGIARCRKGPENFLVTTCDDAHRFRATRAVKYPGRAYPGQRRMINWTVNKCRDALGRSFGFYEAATPFKWKTGYKYSVCFKKTRR